jgi:hypothetical protein
MMQLPIPVIAAIISSSVAIIAPITTYIFTKKWGNRDIQWPDKGRQAIVGTWVGSLIQLVNDQETSIPIEISYSLKGKVIEGDGEYQRPEPIEPGRIKLKFTGGFTYDRYVKFDYKNTDESIKQFGCYIAYLKPDGRSLIGRYVGYGINTEGILHGQLALTKKS